MGPIVAGLDGSAGSAAAATWAAGCARAVGADLLLVSVADGGDDPLEVEVLLEGEWAQPAARVGCPYDSRVVTGDPRLALRQAATASDARLVVVGIGSERWFPALHLGSTSHYLAHHLERPLCVVPVHRAQFDASHIVVGIDGSIGSTAASRWCCDIAREAGGKVTTVAAWEPSALRLARLTTMNSQAEADDSAGEWSSLLEAAGVLAGCRVVRGDAVKAIAATAVQESATMIVVGTRGAGGFHDLRLGSIALRLLQGALLPTVLVPPVA